MWGYHVETWLAVETTMGRTWLRPIWDAWAWFWFRYHCPRPVIDDNSARACVKAGKCGCNNQDRYAFQ